jgi:hypothetical protein
MSSARTPSTSSDKDSKGDFQIGNAHFEMRSLFVEDFEIQQLFNKENS